MTIKEFTSFLWYLFLSVLLINIISTLVIETIKTIFCDKEIKKNGNREKF